MDATKKARLEAKGWKAGDASEFLELTPEEEAYIEIKVALARALKSIRQTSGARQGDIADALGSTQPRVARAEKADPSVSLDFQVRALLAGGATRQELASAIFAG